MRKTRTILTIGSALLLSAVVFSGCTKYASPEDLAALDAKNAEVKKMREAIATCNNENAATNSQVAEAEGQLKKLQDEKAFVEKGLTTFNPDAFLPPPPPVDPKKAGKKK
ncbi:MAG: hypothetical protein L6Q77_06480 [Bacteroidetes bacterium]|nr:hypothetical protein [Bacteroidota bacterium]